MSHKVTLPIIAGVMFRLWPPVPCSVLPLWGECGGGTKGWSQNAGGEARKGPAFMLRMLPCLCCGFSPCQLGHTQLMAGQQLLKVERSEDSILLTYDRLCFSLGEKKRKNEPT